jgi:hypothetical protein
LAAIAPAIVMTTTRRGMDAEMSIVDACFTAY